MKIEWAYNVSVLLNTLNKGDVFSPIDARQQGLFMVTEEPYSRSLAAPGVIDAVELETGRMVVFPPDAVGFKINGKFVASKCPDAT